MKATQAGTQAGLDMNKSKGEEAREQSENLKKNLKEKPPFCQERYSSKKECIEKMPRYMGIRCELCNRGGAI